MHQVGKQDYMVLRCMDNNTLKFTFIEFGIFIKLVRIIKMCLNETYSRVRVYKHLSDIFPVNSGLKQGDALSSLL